MSIAGVVQLEDGAAVGGDGVLGLGPFHGVVEGEAGDFRRGLAHGSAGGAGDFAGAGGIGVLIVAVARKILEIILHIVFRGVGGAAPVAGQHGVLGQVGNGIASLVGLGAVQIPAVEGVGITIHSIDDIVRGGLNGHIGALEVDLLGGQRGRTGGGVHISVGHLISGHGQLGRFDGGEFILALAHGRFAVVGGVVVRTLGPRSVGVRRDLEGHDQLLAGGGFAVDDRVLGIVKALGGDGLDGDVDLDTAGFVAAVCPSVAALVVHDLDGAAGERTVGVQTSKVEVLGQGVGHDGGAVGLHAGLNGISDGLEDGFQTGGVGGGIVVVARTPYAEIFEPGGGGIVGGHAVHILVEVFCRIAGIGFLEHTDGEDLGTGGLQLLGISDGGVGNDGVKAVLMVGFTVGEHDHDLVLIGTGQSLRGLAHAIVRRGRTACFQAVHGFLQSRHTVRGRRGQVLDDLGVVITVIITIIALVLSIKIIRKLHDGNSAGGRLGRHTVNEIVDGSLHGAELGNFAAAGFGVEHAGPGGVGVAVLSFAQLSPVIPAAAVVQVAVIAAEVSMSGPLDLIVLSVGSFVIVAAVVDVATAPILGFGRRIGVVLDLVSHGAGHVQQKDDVHGLGGTRLHLAGDPGFQRDGVLVAVVLGGLDQIRAGSFGAFLPGSVLHRWRLPAARFGRQHAHGERADGHDDRQQCRQPSPGFFLHS